MIYPDDISLFPPPPPIPFINRRAFKAHDGKTQEEPIYYEEMESEIGPFTAVESNGNLIRLFFGRFDAEMAFRFERKETPLLYKVKGQLTEYFDRSRTIFELPLAPKGTPFQMRVWKELLAIPFGTTVSYGEIARRIGQPTASRAVGGAVHRNSIAVIIPCHRVIGVNGHLTGYANGLDKKEFLLNLEK